MNRSGKPGAVHDVLSGWLVVIDQAEPLSTTTPEYLRDVFDRHGVGLILIGMPGSEKQMSRYPQLCGRAGFEHQYRPLRDEGPTFVLARRWRQHGLVVRF